ncbi:hypothetical protein LTR10_015975 [Elasticomyces elasticus]|uniref:Major facilitator superfamily (MFS) profile domain-containing protein n=1 Tax=Exophiala sideris TaxID=1016849 RepID=A0ABR0J1R4_9EURO|nr:hypothetical protein LTR10_015975 [Elasticomyces elasticus]KAK5024687.1 hypothetical protein LTS07_008533 [Exophiala sideris]KAK5030780.1 hypothetical protein LTR13_008134 [Exophiala sideris]KAK5054321.1 hypothetical protein LTR69_008936 [Exophiala sideris]KAK5179723.1 hypothetical protein LTR44_007891 [Eurotiomycetes sp. CCFEE 6388]
MGAMPDPTPVEVENMERMQTTDTNGEVRIHAKTIVVVAAICFTYFAQLVGVVGSGLLAGTITTVLSASGDSVWLSQVITVLTVCLSPIFTQAADYWGRKWLIVSATTFGFVGAIVASRAQTIGTVIGGFTIMGVCYGAQPLLHAVASEVLPRKHRPIAQASINFSAGTGVITGVCMGGGLLRGGELENFRIYLYVVAAIFALATVAIATCYNPPTRELQKTLTFSQKLRSLDWIGYCLLIPGLVLFCVGLAWYKNPYAFSNARVLGTFIAGIVVSIAFFVYETRFKTDGVLHHDLFKHRNFSLALLCVFVEGLAFFAANSYYVYETALFTDNDILISALHFGLISVVANVASVFVGVWSSTRKVLRLPVLIGFVLFLLFFVLMATTTPRSPKNVLWGYPVLAGIGMGILLPTIIVAAQLSTPPHMISLASGLVISIRSLGAAIGIAINNAIYNDALAKNIAPKIAAAVLPLGLPKSSLVTLIPAVVASNATALQNVPGATPEIIAAAQGGLIEAFSIGFRNAWIAAASFVAVAVVGSLFLMDDSSEFTTHIDAPAELSVQVAQERKEEVENIPGQGSHHKEIT